ncbi:MAG: glycosyltransferase family 4 protein [Planctomycetes bacterium]|nr:glycosyltransferase family 4 protein [Planctomycetota bacterium]
MTGGGVRRIRVAKVITRLVRGGAQGSLLRLAAALDKGAFEVHCLSGPETGSEGDYRSLAASLGIPVLGIPHLVRDADPARDLLALGEIVAALARGRYHVVHTYTSKAGILGRAAARLCGVPAVVHSPQGHVFASGGSIPGVSDRPLLRRVFYAVERVSTAWTDRILALTAPDAAEQIALRLAPAGKVDVIPNPVPDEFFLPMDARAARSALGADGAPLLGIVGRLAAEKGHRFLFGAVRRLARDLPGTRLAVVGDGPMRFELEASVREAGLDGRVVFAGLRDDVHRILSGLDVFVLASSYEGQGVVLLEAMAAGVPVVATRVGGVPGVVRDGTDGLLVPYGDEEALAGALRRVWSDRALRERLVESGRERARAFAAGRIAADLGNLYRRVLKIGA